MGHACVLWSWGGGWLMVVKREPRDCCLLALSLWPWPSASLVFAAAGCAGPMPLPRCSLCMRVACFVGVVLVGGCGSKRERRTVCLGGHQKSRISYAAVRTAKRQKNPSAGTISQPAIQARPAQVAKDKACLVHVAVCGGRLVPRPRHKKCGKTS